MGYIHEICYGYRPTFLPPNPHPISVMAASIGTPLVMTIQVLPLQRPHQSGDPFYHPCKVRTSVGNRDFYVCTSGRMRHARGLIALGHKILKRMKK